MFPDSCNKVILSTVRTLINHYSIAPKKEVYQDTNYQGVFRLMAHPVEGLVQKVCKRLLMLHIFKKIRNTGHPDKCMVSVYAICLNCQCVFIQTAILATCTKVHAANMAFFPGLAHRLWINWEKDSWESFSRTFMTFIYSPDPSSLPESLLPIHVA